ncbi:hypothetical protein THS27_24665 [Thalassospira sp. MCCC 1A01428]|nr:hypothetical protein THS27_24665 [Thalassospira sp. MCCC 1A01428]
MRANGHLFARPQVARHFLTRHCFYPVRKKMLAKAPLMIALAGLYWNVPGHSRPLFFAPCFKVVSFQPVIKSWLRVFLTARRFKKHLNADEFA